MIAATASAPEITDGVNAASAGREGIGSPCGIAPRSETLATPGTPARITTTVGTRSATSDATDATRVLDRTASSRTAPRPAATEGRCIWVGWMTTLSAFVRAKLPWLGEPVNAGSCPKRMLALSPVRNPSITDWDTNRT